MHDASVKVFNQIMHGGEIPTEWAELIFIILPKAGDTRDPKNWRPVAIPDVRIRCSRKSFTNDSGQRANQSSNGISLPYRDG